MIEPTRETHERCRFKLHGYSFAMWLPKEKYDPFKVLDLFIQHHGKTEDDKKDNL